MHYSLQGGPSGRGQNLTSNWELHFSIRSLYCDGTLNWITRNSVPRPDGPPCSTFDKIGRSGIYVPQAHSINWGRFTRVDDLRIPNHWSDLPFPQAANCAHVKCECGPADDATPRGRRTDDRIGGERRDATPLRHWVYSRKKPSVGIFKP